MSKALQIYDRIQGVKRNRRVASRRLNFSSEKKYMENSSSAVHAYKGYELVNFTPQFH